METLIVAYRQVVHRLRGNRRRDGIAGGNAMNHRLTPGPGLSEWPTIRVRVPVVAAVVVFIAAGTSCGALSGNQTAGRAAKELAKRPTSKTIVDQRDQGALVILPTLDWEIGDGHFYTQTNGRSQGTSARGFSVTNAEGVPLWGKFRELGGVATLGYPLSRRFEWMGRPAQVFHRGVLQWDPVSQQVAPVNILDELGNAGKDDWLRLNHQTPHPLPVGFDAGKAWEKIVRDRLALLKRSKAIEKYFYQAADPLALYGLPTSEAEDTATRVTIRFQRAVIREWKVDWMGFEAGDIVVENVGEWAIEAGLFPPEALIPE